MALSEPAGAYSTAELGTTKEAMEAFLRDPARLALAEKWLAGNTGSDTQRKVLALFIRTFGCYQMKDEAVALRTECTQVEDTLSDARNNMPLGYFDPKAPTLLVEKSSVGLRTVMKTVSGHLLSLGELKQMAALS
jgi:hypothetical protein